MPNLIYLIAGEASGDALGAKTMRALKAKEPHIRFAGIGGPQMQAEGLKSLFPMEELSLLGFLEILPHIPKLLRRINQTANDIIGVKPDVVLTIDAPAFNRRVIRQLRKTEPHRHHVVHYVAPSVWAYKPKRAAKMAALFDHLLCLLPFEPPYFEQEGLEATCVGHPIVEDAKQGDAAYFRTQLGIASETKLLGILPGSRSSELKRHLPVLKATMPQLLDQYGEMEIVLFATPRFRASLTDEAASWPFKTHLISDDSMKYHAIAACDAALAKSGTGSLDFALAKVPFAIFYKVNPLSAALLRRMIQVEYVNLINIMLNQPVIPELLQEACIPDQLARTATELLRAPDQAAITASYRAMEQLGLNDSQTPSEKAAKVILGCK